MSRASGPDEAPAKQTSVAHFSPIFSTVPPIGYGGVERVIEELTAAQLATCPELDVVVFASADSRPSAPLLARYDSIRSRVPPPELDETFAELRRHYRWAFEEACARGVDVVHLHGPWGLDYRPGDLPMPAVVSIYDDTRRPDVTDALLDPPDGVFLVANSTSTQQKAPQVPWHAAVLEGLAVNRYPVADARADYCCFVGELTPDKGLDIAIAVARAAGVPLKIIGRPRMLDVPDDVAEEQQRFLGEILYPCIDGSSVDYLGELGEERLPIVARARALLAPMRIEEPFGRAMAEAMACGTPVVTFRRGSAPEIIDQGVSGFYVKTEVEMVDALRRAPSLLASACRAHVRRVLNVERVAASYADIYRSVLHTRVGGLVPDR